jgi:nitrate reductase molybdenum cofactor assembly chaperone NarJ/NarW
MNSTRAENSDKIFCELFAVVFSYPVETYKQSVEQLSELSEKQDIHLPGLEAFNQLVQNTALARLEELFTITFDMNPDTCLELGWHLYGESYQRGEFLVKMRQALDAAGVAE